MPSLLTIAISLLGSAMALATLASEDSHAEVYVEGGRALSVGAAAHLINVHDQEAHSEHRRSSLVRRHRAPMTASSGKDSPGSAMERSAEDEEEQEQTSVVGACLATNLSAHVANSATPACLEGVSFSHGMKCTPMCESIMITDPDDPESQIRQSLFPTVNELECINGTFDPPTFECAPTGKCQPPHKSLIANAGNTTCQEAVIDDDNLCNPICAEGFLPFVTGPTNFDTLRCHNGTLTPMRFQCLTASQKAAAKAADEESVQTHRRRRSSVE